MKCIVKKNKQLDILKVWSHLLLFYQFAQVKCSHFNRNPRELEFEMRAKDLGILGSSWTCRFAVLTIILLGLKVTLL